MKKIMLAFVLAIASSVWTMSEAICITQRSSFPGDDSWYGGTLQLVGMPCEEGEVCPPCLTVALMMYGHTYYLAGDERMNSLQAQLDTIEYPAKALINGVYYKQGSFDFIYVEQLFLNPENQYRLPSLCDTWNVLMDNRFTLGSAEGRCWTDRFKLQGDTIINNTKYAQMLYADGLYTYAQLQWNYYGSIRETENAEIYFIPAGQNKEYLLYAFNAKVGDIFKNLYGMIEGNDVWAEVKEVTEKEIVLELKGRYEDVEYTYFENYVWIKGVGANLALFQPLPSGTEGGPIINNLLCAYRNDEQVYTSEMGQKYGCYYDGGTQQDRLPSLCDEWNVLMDSGFELGPVYGEIWTNGFKVQGDTIINNIIYSRLLFADGHQKKQRESREWVYYGALREAANAEIYFIPAGQNKEYLLYAFNAQVGDRMNNLYIMDDYKEWNVWAIVKEISGNEIILDFYEQLDDREDIVWHNYTWVKGIGAKRSMFQPIPINSGGGVVNFLLCAYNDEKHIYTSEFGEKYGCYYDGEKPQATTWHCVSVYRDMFDYDNVYFSPATYQLQGDTLFGDTRYKTLRSENGTYWGAVRKTDDGQQVYYRPGEGTGKYPASLGKEYLLYDFSVKEGDTVVAYNGFMDTSIEDGTPEPSNLPLDTMVVVSVNMIDGRKHILIQMLNYLNLHLTQQAEWIEGIGTRNILFCYDRNFLPGNNWGLYTLCAEDSEGNILYSFDTDYLGVHNNCPDFTLITNTPPSDTIPLFKDGPGSSTVQPVDPNQIVAVLQMDVLSIFEHIGKEIGYKLTVLSSSENASASRRMVKSDTFEQSVSVSLAESGTYMLELTNPDWDYTIVGTFEYNSPHGIEPVETSVPAAQKILQNGQLLIRKGEKIYTLTGVQIQ